MSELFPETVWRTPEKELLSLLDAGTIVPKPKVVRFYAPSFRYYRTTYYRSSQIHFPTVSVTGRSCALNCKHCGGKVLETMVPARRPKTLFELAEKLKQNGAFGLLVSGGFSLDGSVPLKQFFPIIERIKRELNLTVFVHTGITDLETAVGLKNAGVDAVLMDIIGSDGTIRKIYNLNITVKDFANSLKALQKAGLNFVPHVVVGLHGGKLKGEFNALKIIASVKPSAVVVIAFMPIHGTTMAKVKPPQPADIAKVTATARLMFPQTPLALGCMRPKGKHRSEIDVLALKAGVDAIAFPSQQAVKYAENKGYVFSFSSHCCSQIYSDTNLFEELSK
jgi:uncharacterized radical SAM superfamily protein